MSALLFMAPALAFALALLARRFPGERRLVALAARRRRRAARRAPVRVTAAMRTPWAVAPRGGALLARALATWPPTLALRS